MSVISRATVCGFKYAKKFLAMFFISSETCDASRNGRFTLKKCHFSLFVSHQYCLVGKSTTFPFKCLVLFLLTRMCNKSADFLFPSI